MIFPALAALALSAQSPERPAASCDADRAARVSVQTIGAHPERWLGRCVTVTGPVLARAIYSGVEGMYLVDRRNRRGRRTRQNLAHRVGLGSRDDHFPVPATTEMWTVTGTVDSCERRGREALRVEAQRNREAEARGSDEIHIVMLGGYCHSYEGAVLDVVSRSTEPSPRFVRLMGDRAAAAYGSLIEPPRDLRYLPRIRRLAQNLREAMATGDRSRLSTLFGRFGADDTELDYLLVDPESPFRELRTLRPVALAILVNEFDPWGRDLEDPVRTEDAFLCFCREANCRRRWPIHEMDTRPSLGRPYACFQTNQDGAGEIFAGAVIGLAPLAEPPASHGSTR